MIQRFFLTIKGIVQGVGFRPFIYNLARSMDMKGWINNSSEGVYIDVEGTEENINMFVKYIKQNKPQLAQIDSIEVIRKDYIGYSSFEIKSSEEKTAKATLVSPDIAICKDCLEDIMEFTNHRYQYPFTNCTNCGPRFSIIKDIPYDRKYTTMNQFTMCKVCKNEYEDPNNRRFHAQPNACPECGPKLWVEDNVGRLIAVNDSIEFILHRLEQGNIIGIKGIGGFHLVCDATNEKVIEKLRIRKKRMEKPFAVMMKDLSTIKEYCYVNDKEKEILEGIRKPIVLLNKLENCNLPSNIAPAQKTLGAMLPYTPLHHLLFQGGQKILIMTSANLNGLPIEYRDDRARRNLIGIVDYFLFNNREINIPVDDSVVRVIEGEEIIIRRARGYVPLPIKFGCTKNILSCGSNMKNTFCVSKENNLFLSQHNGDLDTLESYENYQQNIEHFKHIFRIEPEYIAIDKHEGYISSQYSQNYNLPVIKIQHHHAHVVSCLIENNISEKVIGVVFDGTGYGDDGAIWGGEFLVTDIVEYERVGHLDYIKIPGGDSAMKEPWKSGVAYLYKAFKGNKSLDDIIERNYGDKGKALLKVIKADINCHNSSSMGRLFDAVASIIGIRNKISFEGQAAMELESLIEFDSEESYVYSLKKEEEVILDMIPTIKEILDDKIKGVNNSKIALKFHNTLIKATVEICKKVRSNYGISNVAISGGVFQNSYLLKNVRSKLVEADFNVYINKSIPCNDGGIALGQIAIASEYIKKSEKIHSSN